MGASAVFLFILFRTPGSDLFSISHSVVLCKCESKDNFNCVANRLLAYRGGQR